MNEVFQCQKLMKELNFYKTYIIDNIIQMGILFYQSAIDKNQQFKMSLEKIK